MRFAVDEEPRREVAGALYIEDVCLAFWRLSLTRVTKGQRVCAEGSCKHAQRHPDKILFQRRSRIGRRPRRAAARLAGRPPRSARHLVRPSVWGGGGSTATRRRCPRRWASPPSWSRIAGLQHHVAVEAATVRSAFACRNLVGTKVLIGKFDEDLEKDRNEVVALKLTSSAARDDGLNR